VRYQPNTYRLEFLGNLAPGTEFEYCGLPFCRIRTYLDETSLCYMTHTKAGDSKPMCLPEETVVRVKLPS
jgi:hypothetical protein